MIFPNRREGFFLIVLGCVGAIGWALYAQYVLGLEPCPLCILQRFGVLVVAAIAFVAALISSSARGFRIGSVLVILAALVGSSISIRQLWLQSLPLDQAPMCGPGLSYMIQTLPITSVLIKVLQGSGECAVVAWTFLGIATPGWVLLFFVIVVIFTAWQWKRHC